MTGVGSLVARAPACNFLATVDGGKRCVVPQLHHPAGGLRTCPRENRRAVVGHVRRAPWKRSLASLAHANN
eukprot:2392151-Pyramimonas_sp.AAC.1